MSIQHDPMRQISYLQQCLSQDKKPLGLFLGAGCPVAIRSKNGDISLPLIPDIAGISVEVCKRISLSDDCREELKVIQEHFFADDRPDTNIEDILSHVRALRSVSGKDKVRGLTSEQLDKLDARICDIIHELANKSLPNSDTPYHRLAAWVEATVREFPVQIFTTNYDLLMEQAFENLWVPYFDGFAGACNPFFDLRTIEEDKLPPRWARLWKLHGSINWFQDLRKGVFRGAVNEKRPKRVIHPSHLKYDESRRMPYLAMIDRLRAFFKQPAAALIICGYSFRDDHINEVIVQELQGNPSGTTFALLFDELEAYPKAIKLAIGRSNLALLARNGAIIGSRQSIWMEKDKQTIHTANGHWVRWHAQDETDENSKYQAEFCLGDFTVFGNFVQELAGQKVQQTEVPNDK